MTTRVQLPPGCSGITCEDGKVYNGKKGGFVDVEDHHAYAINKQIGPAAKMLNATGALSFGTKKGRWCFSCVPPEHWNVWTHTCHKCGQPTEADPESSVKSAEV